MKSFPVTGTLAPPAYQYASGRITYLIPVVLAFADFARSRKYWPLSFRLNAPCNASEAPTRPPASWLQQLRFWLKPLMSCSSAQMVVSLALRPATVRGVWANAWANGIAAGVPRATLADPETLVVAVADAVSTSTAVAAPARSQSRLCIKSLRLKCAGSSNRTAAPAISDAPWGVPSRCRRRRGSLVRPHGVCQSLCPGQAQTAITRPTRSEKLGCRCGTIASMCCWFESA